MSVAFNPLPAAASPYQEPPRPAPQANHESARPVIAAEKSEAAAREARRDEDNRILREQERQAEQRTAARRSESASTEPETPRPAPARNDIYVGSLVDDYA